MKNGQAEDGRTALEMLRAAAETGVPYDLAILDMQMQGMDGVQVAQAVKADPAISHTRLVLLTSLGWRGEEAHRVGIEACLTKPVKQSELYDTLATVMSSTVGEAEPKRRHEARLVTRHSIEEAKARSGARLSHAHVLVAEDNAVNQKVAVRMLERLGYRADVAANGLEALEALSRVPYAAVLMDVQMPEMDGYEATAKIRRHEGPKGRHTPIVAMTANALQGDREKALEAGMDDYVSKPVKPEELEAVLKRWIPEPDTAASASEEETGGAVAPEDTTSSLDRSVLEGLRELQEEGELDIIAELIELFSSDVPPQLVALREAVEGGNAHLVERIAHTLKGSCGNMGAIRMAKFCEQLQEVGASQDLVKVPGLLDQLEAEFHRVCSMLQAERSRNQY
jgi:CheY-like chemotaxis protein